MKISKKGFGVQWYFIILAVIIALTSYYVTSYYGKKQIDNYIGEYQFSIMESTNKAANADLYIETAAIFSLQDSIYEVAHNGGFSEMAKSECGSFSGTNTWHEIRRTENGLEDISCFDDDGLIENIAATIDLHLNRYLEENPLGLETGNYEYKIENGVRVKGFAKNPLKITIKNN